ncbi:MAG: hypothetical protein F6J97_07430 [Leptolyngbya sp. SIO4C1]|nr:hypothetical protein [Leptolyngbya sp. SIO4C1]
MKFSRSSLLTLGAIVSLVLGIILRFAFLNRHELWYDEALSVLLASGQRLSYQAPETVPVALKTYSALLQIPAESGLGDIIETFKNLLKGLLGDPHPPLFYLSQQVWMRGLGNGVAAMRSLVVLTSLVTIALSYQLGKLVLGRQGGLLLSALLALNPFFLAHSLNLRMYTLLVFWTVLSQWSLLALIEQTARGDRQPLRRFGLLGLLAIAIAGGLLSQYLFAYSLLALAVLAVTLGRRRWLQYGLALAAGVVLALPWVLWGTRQQINNRSDVLSQISEAGGWLEAALRHLQGIAQTLASQLVLGHWVTGMAPLEAAIKPAAVLTGLGVMVGLLVCLWGLYRQREYRLLLISFVLGILPLLIALGLDIVTYKFTVGFGWGRSLIVALPGCLLLITSWLMRATGRWQMPLSLGLLTLYLAIGAGDFTLRDRAMFQTANRWVGRAPSQSTLLVMNSKAWGNVARLAYYVNPDYSVDLLAVPPQTLPAALADVLDADARYQRVIWLNAQDPVWAAPQTAAEANQLEQTVAAVLDRYYALAETASLSGTMDIDQFILRLYESL